MEPRRDRHSRYLIPPVDGGPEIAHTRVTTIAGAIADRYGLEKWGQQKLALGFSRQPDLLARVAAARDDDKATLDKIVAAALEAGGRSTSANVGTALHEFAERVDLGEDVEVLDPWKRDIAAYRSTMAEAGFTVSGVELVVVVPGLSEPVAGTLDRLVERQGVTYIADLKSGQSLVYSWPEIVVQVSLYSRAETIYDPETSSHRTMPAVDQHRGLVVHLPAGQGACRLYWVDLDKGWEAAELALRVRAWRSIKNLGRPFDPDERAFDLVAERRTWLTRRVRHVVAEFPEAGTDLARTWPIGVPTLKSDHAHTGEELDRIVEVVAAVEREHRLPFFDPDPRVTEPLRSVKKSTKRGTKSTTQQKEGTP